MFYVLCYMLCLCVYTCVHVHACHSTHTKTRENMKELALSLQSVGSRDETQAIGFVDRPL